MSINRMCPCCFQREAIRYNFGHDFEAEIAFHREKWCDCGYNSAEEMMEDQDFGFKDPDWVLIAKYFIEYYHCSIADGRIESFEELVRFFLRLLKDSANNAWLSIDLVPIKEDEHFCLVADGVTDKTPRTTIINYIRMTSLEPGFYLRKGFRIRKWRSYKNNFTEQMMIDEMMGFKDPRWMQIARYFIENYHAGLASNKINTYTDLVRFFLKLLRSSANYFNISIELVPRREDEEYTFVYHGKKIEKKQSVETTGIEDLRL